MLRRVPSFDDYEPPGDLEDGDGLFGQRGPWQYEAQLDFDPLREYRYLEGYRTAAEFMSGHVLKNRHDVEVLVVPILFCYRHWVELRLKDLWALRQTLANEESPPLGTHDLRALWGHVRPLFEEVWPDGDRAELDRLEVILHELADADPRESFRYSVGKDGTPSLPEDLVRINVLNVRRVMAKVAILLDGAASFIEEHLSYREDWR
jgi:hypothetical protein